jgi:pyruvate ferredoxin oxidoreductase alpha subunit
MGIRQELHNDLRGAQDVILQESEKLRSLLPDIVKKSENETKINNGLIEYYGPKNPKTVLVAMGSVAGTIKDAIDKNNKLNLGGLARRSLGVGGSAGILKIKSFRPFPSAQVLDVIRKSRYVAVIEKAISLGATDGPLALDVKSAAKNHTVSKVQSFIVGLGGKDITGKMIDNIISQVRKNDDKTIFIDK